MSGSPVERAREVRWWRTSAGRKAHTGVEIRRGILWAHCGVRNFRPETASDDRPRCKRCNAALLRALPGGGE